MSASLPFYDVFYSKIEKVNRVLDRYQKDPSKENIHDIRTSIRRLESAYSIFPKSSKTKKSDKFIYKYKEFFSENTKIRDLDIILEKLEENGYEQESVLVLTLTKNKLKRLRKALKSAKKLSELKKPKIKEFIKIHSKFEKRTISLINEFKKYVPIVIGDESKVDELHVMRKQIKKLRYVLELEPSNSYQIVLSQLKNLQQLLGDIHDCDIFVWTFEKKIDKIPGIEKFIQFEQRKRSAIYRNLVNALSGFDSG